MKEEEEKKKKKEIPLQLVKRGPIFLNSFDVRTRNLTKKTPRQRFRSNLNFTRIYEKEGGINICVQLRKELERFHHPSKGHNKVSSSPSSFSSSGNVTGDKLLSSAPARGETRWSVGVPREYNYVKTWDNKRTLRTLSPPPPVIFYNPP